MERDGNYEHYSSGSVWNRNYFYLQVESKRGNGWELMSFVIESRYLEGVVAVAPQAYRDERGFFMETYRADHFEKLGLPARFVQDNQSFSHKGMIRGLHFQWDPPLGKLMRVTHGAAFLVAVDIRKGSPRLGKWVGLEVSSENMKQVWAPAGFARGFCALTEKVEVQYKCTAIYSSKAESAIRWNDPDIGIKWPMTDVVLSQKDREAKPLTEWLKSPNSEHLLYGQPANLSV
jgi:dTDP-4-dehydrorhamnose 3,5-epimerase